MKWYFLSATGGFLALGLFLFGAPKSFAQPPGLYHPIVLQDFEKAPAPKAWVVNIPEENAKVSLSADHPKEGKQCLKLSYRFLDKGGIEYLGIPNPIRVNAPIHKVKYWIFGDNSKCGYALQVADAHGETHQFGKAAGQGGVIDFQGWKLVEFDLDKKHETWGGDNNGKMDYPLTSFVIIIGQPEENGKGKAASGDLYFDSLTVDSEGTRDETLGGKISVLSPEYCSEIRGTVRVKVTGPSFSQLTAKCWKQGSRFGTDATVATIELDNQKQGSFEFTADQFPHGPLTLRISGQNKYAQDNCYLQLYNRGGISWNEGIPKEAPPAAKDMKLIFADDFTGPLSISSKDPQATYYSHKPPHGWQDFSQHVFSDFESNKNPFHQVDTYLRIRASDKTKSSGLISSLKNDGSGIKVKAPCYFECRFLGPNSIGTWPGFWLMTDYMTGYDKLKDKTPCDELDIIEAYGGEGPGSPNAKDAFMITPHCWNQGEAGKSLETKAEKTLKNPARMHKFGIPSTWYESFHVYGCKVTETETIYYCDNIELGRHATLPLSKKEPLFFMVNLATGGGWPVDLSRYNGLADMYIDYIRVYAGP
ncbi:family 16 glycosylhydrolase [Telmatocola sphagniphila]|uniref:Family 16 glycosylhydrolase n=1 Tax=Telmatocola sphagniphila TaxID=1123043 RepID=A0A8E6B8A2_9BACT|nr:family 16 glycosylhydrolase [Telmatocola sphagniphila]QVL33586.1 family 16 glycosylhydrolase [Telmatocola sphagniphila]